jgi:hypothetical protein
LLESSPQAKYFSHILKVHIGKLFVTVSIEQLL